jgi:hypothetical protein
MPGVMCHCVRNWGNTAEAENHVPMHKIDAVASAASARHLPGGSIDKPGFVIEKERAS